MSKCAKPKYATMIKGHNAPIVCFLLKESVILKSSKYEITNEIYTTHHNRIILFNIYIILNLELLNV